MSKLAEEIAKELARNGYLSRKPTISKVAVLVDEKLSRMRGAVKPLADGYNKAMQSDYFKRNRADQFVDVCDGGDYYQTPSGFIDMDMDGLQKCAELYESLLQKGAIVKT